MMNAWYKFVAYNTQALYGYGTPEQAEKFADQLNKDRDINVYHIEEITDAEEIAKLDQGYGDSFNLDDEE